MFEIREKSGQATRKLDNSKVPYSAELEKFLIESRKYQTLYSGCEGYDKSRIFQFHQKNLIAEFVAFTIFFKRCYRANMLKMDEDVIVENITERMIEESQKYNCEVHINVIWVCYFVYKDEKTEFLPVFKIYKDKCHQAIYLDIFLKVYQTWDCYLDGPGLGESLLCVPRKGEYHFDGKSLSLEYVLSKGTHLEYESKFRLWVKDISSFSQATLSSWVRKVQAWLSNHPVLLEAVNKFLNFFKRNGHIVFRISLALLSALATSGLGIEPAFVVCCWEAARIICTFINSQEVSGGSSSLKMFELEIQKAISTYTNTNQEASKLLVLLNQSLKDWPEILSTLCCLIQKCNRLDSTPVIKAVQRENFTSDDRTIARDEEARMPVADILGN